MELTTVEVEALERSELNVNTEEEYLSYPAAFEDYTDSYGQPVTAMDGQVTYIVTPDYLHLAMGVEEVIYPRNAENQCRWADDIRRTIVTLYAKGWGTQTA